MVHVSFGSCYSFRSCRVNKADHTAQPPMRQGTVRAEATKWSELMQCSSTLLPGVECPRRGDAAEHSQGPPSSSYSDPPISQLISDPGLNIQPPPTCVHDGGSRSGRRLGAERQTETEE